MWILPLPLGLGLSSLPARARQAAHHALANLRGDIACQEVGEDVCVPSRWSTSVRIRHPDRLPSHKNSSFSSKPQKAKGPIRSTSNRASYFAHFGVDLNGPLKPRIKSWGKLLRLLHPKKHQIYRALNLCYRASCFVKVYILLESHDYFGKPLVRPIRVLGNFDMLYQAASPPKNL